MIRESGNSTSIRARRRTRTNPRRRKATPRRTGPKRSNQRMIRPHPIPPRRSKRLRAIRSPASRAESKNNRETGRSPRRKTHPKRRPEESAARRQVLPPNNRIKGTTARAIRVRAPLRANSPDKGNKNQERLKAPKDRQVNRAAALRVPRARMAIRAVPGVNPPINLDQETAVMGRQTAEARGSNQPSPMLSRTSLLGLVMALVSRTILRTKLRRMVGVSHPRSPKRQLPSCFNRRLRRPATPRAQAAQERQAAIGTARSVAARLGLAKPEGFPTSTTLKPSPARPSAKRFSSSNRQCSGSRPTASGAAIPLSARALVRPLRIPSATGD